MSQNHLLCPIIILSPNYLRCPKITFFVHKPFFLFLNHLFFPPNRLFCPKTVSVPKSFILSQNRLFCPQIVYFVPKLFTVSQNNFLCPQTIFFVPKSFILSLNRLFCPRYIYFVPNSFILACAQGTVLTNLKKNIGKTCFLFVRACAYF